jgi:curved DNA-binding protein CbpA
MKYLNNIKDLSDLKKEYRRLAFELHPDHGGNVENMQILNNEYEKLFNTLKHQYNAENKDNQTKETAEMFINIIEMLQKFENLDMEICGNWLWVGGNTYPHRHELRKFLDFSKNKSKWYWRADEFKNKWYKPTADMDTIRTKYGSQKIASKSKNNILKGD